VPLLLKASTDMTSIIVTNDLLQLLSNQILLQRSKILHSVLRFSFFLQSFHVCSHVTTARCVKHVAILPHGTIVTLIYKSANATSSVALNPHGYINTGKGPIDIALHSSQVMYNIASCGKWMCLNYVVGSRNLQVNFSIECGVHKTLL
jgi:hypothetical protein